MDALLELLWIVIKILAITVPLIVVVAFYMSVEKPEKYSPFDEDE